MKKSFGFLLIFCALMIAVYAAKGPLISQFFQWYIKGYCRTCLSSRLTYDSVRYENGRWIFETPVLTTQKRLEEGGYSCQAEKATIDVSLFLTSFRLNLDIEIDSPHIDIGNGAKELKSIFSRQSQTFRLLNVHMNFKVPEGSILVHDFNEEHLVPIPLFFNMDFTCREKKEGCASLWLGKSAKEKHDFLAVFSQVESDKSQLSLDFYNVDCFPLQQIFRGIWKELNFLQVEQGSLGGRLTFSFPKESSPYGEGQVELNNLVALHNESGLEIKIPSLKISLLANRDLSSSLSTVGIVESTPFSLTLKKDKDVFWQSQDLVCKASFQTSDEIKFQLTGNIDSPSNRRHMNLQGYGSFAEVGKTGLLLNLDLTKDHGDEHTSAYFSAREVGEHWSFGEVEVFGFGSDELKLLQHLSLDKDSEWQEFKILKGKLDASAVVYLKGLKLSEVQIEQVRANHLHFDFLPWNLSGSVLKGLGSLSFDLSSEEPLKTLNAGMDIRNASLNLEGLEKAKWEFSRIHTDLKVNQGVIQKSRLIGTIAGLDAEIFIDGTNQKTFADLNFKGKFADFAKALPDPLKAGVEKEFSKDELMISAEVAKLSEVLDFKGKIIVLDEFQKSNEINFGFAIEKSSVGLWHRWPPHPIAADYFPNAGFEAIGLTAPAIASPLNAIYSHLIKQKLGVGAISIKNGWFQANHLALEKYLSSFIFSKNQMHLSGIGDFIGNFDGQKLVVHYDANKMVVENSDFRAEIPRISEGLPLNAKVGEFVFDFDKKAIFNSFPIQNGTYLEKNTGLVYTEVGAKICMQNTVAHLSEVKTFCQGLYFEGEIDLDWSMPGDGVFDVAFLLSGMNGKVSNLRNFLSHINNDIPLLKIPIEGIVSLQKKQATLQFSFFKGGYDLQTEFLGKLTDGSLSGENVDMSLRELNFNFDYNHLSNTLNFSEIQGTLLVGKSSHVEEYSVSSDKLKFTNYRNSEAEFDFWIGDKIRNILRIAGHTSSETKTAPLVIFHFDKALTHFGNVHPYTLDLTLKNWSEIFEFKLEYEFQLKNLFSDLKKFSRTGLFFLSRNLLKELEEVTIAEGNFDGSIEYEKDRSVMRYYVKGSEVLLGTQFFNKFLLSGTKKDNLWSIDQMQLDDISLACDVVKNGPIWDINFFGARFGTSMMVGLEGKYREDDARLDAKINVFEANLFDISKWPSFQSLLQGYSISGDARGSGLVHVDFDKTLPLGMRIDAVMTSALNHPSFGVIYLQDIQDMKFKYKSDVGFSFSDVVTGLKSTDDEIKAQLSLKNASFQFNKREFLIENLAYEIQALHLPWFSKLMKENFPLLISKDAVDILEKLKSQGHLHGVMNGAVGPVEKFYTFKFTDGLYTIFGKDYELNNLVFEYRPLSISARANVKHEFQFYNVTFQAILPSLEFGEIVLSEFTNSPFVNQNMPLVASWKNDKDHGFYIQSLYGTFKGATFNLNVPADVALSKDSFSLIGRIDLDLNTFSSVFDAKLRDGFKSFKLGAGYSLLGQFNFSKVEALPISERVNFQGQLHGLDFEFLGYRFYNLYADAAYNKNALIFRNFMVNDYCGSLQSQQIDIINHQDAWIATSPQIVLSEFRPSVLNSQSLEKSKTGKSLVIRHMEVNQFQGVLGDQNSFTGYGHLSFVNPPKKNLQHPIFTIPIELLTRIGLDMSALTPIRGSIFYELKNGKASITKFKDVYSKGKLSKFNLANNGYESYVDFDGNLHLDVKMKQYNLIFKLAELFTVSVQGSLKNPVYTLQKQ